MATTTIRPATPDDAAALAVLLDRFDGAGATPAQVAARLQASAQVLTTYLADVDGQVAGFVCLRLLPHLQGDAPYAELTDIYVDPPFRRRGVAGALMAEVEAAARAAGAVEVVVITGFESDGAQAAYRSQGYGVWALAMRKCLHGAEGERCVEP
ncbi:MAG: GNAT family N-acetyltransferase [Thermomicrobiales bacterium]|nr:GNAT family N-acetyltransferase [Thermomicrobiales bacterium]